MALATLELPFTGDTSQRTYLGISAETKLALGRVNAERLIIIVFNSFCTICQADAPVFNMVYQIIEDDPRLKGRVKLVGIAAGNTEMEVADFREKHEVPFPLVADPKFLVDGAISFSLRIPLVIAARVSGASSLEVIKAHAGPLSEPEEILTVLQQVRSSKLLEHDPHP